MDTMVCMDSAERRDTNLLVKLMRAVLKGLSSNLGPHISVPAANSVLGTVYTSPGPLASCEIQFHHVYFEHTLCGVETIGFIFQAKKNSGGMRGRKTRIGGTKYFI